MIPNVIIPLILMLTTVLICLVALAQGSMFLLSVLSVVPFLVLLVMKPDLLLVLTCWLFYSSIRIPGLWAGRHLYELLMLMIFMMSIFTGVVIKRSVRHNWSFIFALLFLIILIVIMLVRGFGFQSLGGATWGGGRYLDLFPCILFFLSAENFKISTKQWRIAVAGMLICALVPGIAALLYKMSGGRILWQYYIVTSSSSAVKAFQTGGAESLNRFTSFIEASYIFLLPFVLWPVKGKDRVYYLIFIIAALPLMFLTGHRLMLVTMFLYLWIFFFSTAKNKLFYSMASLVLIVVLIILIIPISIHLPRDAQRVLSVIPFVPVDPDVRIDATGTSVWRVMLWKEAIRQISHYLWLGKGYAYNATEYLYAIHNAYKSEYHNLIWALESSSYHQGLLSLLIGMGLPGLVAGMGFMVSILYRHYKVDYKEWKDIALVRVHYAMYIMFLVMFLIYIFVYGDVFRSFPPIFVYAAILEGVKGSAERDEEPHSGHDDIGAGISPIIPRLKNRIFVDS